MAASILAKQLLISQCNMERMRCTKNRRRVLRASRAIADASQSYQAGMKNRMSKRLKLAHEQNLTA